MRIGKANERQQAQRNWCINTKGVDYHTMKLQKPWEYHEARFTNTSKPHQMAYNKQNKNRQIKYILDVYKLLKQSDIPDTRIVKNQFPKHGIFISYRKWKYIKGMKPSELE